MINKKNINRQIFTLLTGKWTFKRNITQYDRGGQTSTATGEIYFLQQSNPCQLIYRENGQFYLNEGSCFKISREYEYELVDDCIQIYFMDKFGKRSHLFMTISFQEEGEGLWVASSEHTCGKDIYKGKFEIKFDKKQINFFTISFSVKGPQKDYESLTYISPLSLQ